MADKSQPGGVVVPPTNGNGINPDAIVERLVPNPNDPPDVIMMVGFLGRSTRPRFWRLYRTLDLKDYVEIAEGDIVLTESLETKLQPLGGTAVWVKSGARLQHIQNESQLAESEFLQGDIIQKCLPGMATGMDRSIVPGAAAAPGFTRKLWCWSYRPRCTNLPFCTFSCTNFDAS